MKKFNELYESIMGLNTLKESVVDDIASIYIDKAESPLNKLNGHRYNTAKEAEKAFNKFKGSGKVFLKIKLKDGTMHGIKYHHGNKYPDLVEYLNGPVETYRL